MENVKRSNEKNGAKNYTLFSKHTSMSMDTRKTRRNNNVMVFAQSGDTARDSFIKPNILQGNSSFVIRDTTGNLLKTMRAPLEEMGYEIRVLDLRNPEQSNRYNPFFYVRNEESVLHLVDILLRSQETQFSRFNSDPFYDKAERLLLQALCFYIQSEHDTKDRTFSSILRLFRQAEKEDYTSILLMLDDMFSRLEEREPESNAVLSYKAFKTCSPGTIGSGLIHSIAIRLQVFNVPEMRKLASSDDIDLYSIGDRPVALFCIPVDGAPFINFLESMLYTQAFEALYYQENTKHKGHGLPHHVRFFFEDFRSIVYIPNFRFYMSTMRPYHISVSIIVQSVSCLKAKYPNDFDIISGNCDTHLFFCYAVDALSPNSTRGYLTTHSLSTSVYDLRQECYQFRESEPSSRREDFFMLQRAFWQDDDICFVFVRGADSFLDKKL